jgi:hypothetical protein
VSDQIVDDQDRAKTTEFVASRMMKCQARHHVYSERARETGNPALGNVTALESDFLRETERDWRSVLARWGLASRLERSSLLVILGRAKERARRDVRVAFDDQPTADLLALFFDSLKVEDMIPPQGAS